MLQGQAGGARLGAWAGLPTPQAHCLARLQVFQCPPDQVRSPRALQPCAGVPWIGGYPEMHCIYWQESPACVSIFADLQRGDSCRTTKQLGARMKASAGEADMSTGWLAQGGNSKGCRRGLGACGACIAYCRAGCTWHLCLCSPRAHQRRQVQ